MKVLMLCVVAVVVLQLPSSGDAVCCHTHKYKHNGVIGHRCNDCFASMKYCGVGSCNLFGCNCDNGRCRTGVCSKDTYRRSLDAHDVIRAADVDEDGAMSLEEALAHLDKMDGARVDKMAAVRAAVFNPQDEIKRSLEKMDVNNDRFLSADEIDA